MGMSGRASKSLNGNRVNSFATDAVGFHSEELRISSKSESRVPPFATHSVKSFAFGHPDAERIDPSRPVRSWRSAWRRALKDAGLRIRFHDLRHTCITKLAEGQASEQTLVSIAGHLSRKMLEHYSHIRVAAKRAAVDAIAKPVFDAGVAQNWAQRPSIEKTAVPN
jgi:integrase